MITIFGMEICALAHTGRPAVPGLVCKAGALRQDIDGDAGEVLPGRRRLFFSGSPDSACFQYGEQFIELAALLFVHPVEEFDHPFFM